MNIKIKNVLEDNYFNKRYWLNVEGFDFEVLFERVCLDDNWDHPSKLDLEYFRPLVKCDKLNKFVIIETHYSEQVLSENLMKCLKSVIALSMK